MGIAFALFYIPAYCIIGAIALFLGIYLGEWEKPYFNKKNIFLAVLGSIIAIALTAYSIHFIYKIETHNDGWDRLIYSIACSLIAPIIFGLFTVLIAKLIRFKKEKSSTYLIVNKIGAGMFHGVWLLPAVLIFYSFGFNLIVGMLIYLINIPMMLINGFFDLLV